MSSLLINLGVLVELKTGQAPPTKLAALEAAAGLGLPMQPAREILALKRGETKPDAAELKRLYAAFMGTVQEAARMVDQL
ncbi:MAG: hypothetical protein HYY24_17020 [Verrucomicrobia bacterium]|nr:hypothetical protein [Verrucomicrobiota bacterium]